MVHKWTAGRRHRKLAGHIVSSLRKQREHEAEPGSKAPPTTCSNLLPGVRLPPKRSTALPDSTTSWGHFTFKLKTFFSPVWITELCNYLSSQGAEPWFTMDNGLGIPEVGIKSYWWVSYKTLNIEAEKVSHHNPEGQHLRVPVTTFRNKFWPRPNCKIKRLIPQNLEIFLSSNPAEGKVKANTAPPLPSQVLPSSPMSYSALAILFNSEVTSFHCCLFPLSAQPWSLKQLPRLPKAFRKGVGVNKHRTSTPPRV